MGEAGESEEIVPVVSSCGTVELFDCVECISVIEVEIMVCVCWLACSAGLEDGNDMVNAEII